MKMYYSISKNGFYGHLYHPEQDKYPGQALLVLGGGGMPYRFTLAEARAFSGIGITSLAVGYFGVEGAPKTIRSVPVEYVERAAQLLHTEGYDQVTAAGISKGAELALISGTLTEEINGVIAMSPSSRIYMGIGPGLSWVKESSWTFRGQPLPFAYAEASGWSVLLKSMKARELTFRFVYEKANRVNRPDARIPVEKIQGPVLVCASEEDSLWPAAEACDEIIDRLNQNNFAYPYKKLVYPYASHILLPFETGLEKYFRVGRKYPEECGQTIRNLREVITEWLKQ